MDDETALGMESRDRARQARDFQLSETGPAARPMGKGFPRQVIVWMTNDDGKACKLTETQHRIVVFIRTHEGERFTATVIAHSLGVAISTVTRTVNLAVALKLIAVDVIRGRFGGIEILSRAWADLKMRSRNAWARIKEQGRKADLRWQRRLDESHYFTSGFNFASIEVVHAKLNS